jgi:ferritin-like metal-binding protein YciE
VNAGWDFTAPAEHRWRWPVFPLKRHSRSGEKTMPSQAARNLFIVGLRNAHAMENQAHEVLERQVDRLGDYPKVQVRIRQHLEETKQQIQRLEQCLEAAGESTSTLKDAAMAFMGNMAAMAHAVAGDEILKTTFANNALEHYEIAAYKSLLALCPRAGLESAAAPLQTSLKEEERMAQWVEQNVEEITLDCLAREERARTAA